MYMLRWGGSLYCFDCVLCMSCCADPANCRDALYDFFLSFFFLGLISAEVIGIIIGVFLASVDTATLDSAGNGENLAPSVHSLIS